MSFILDLLATTAKGVEVAGLEQALEVYKAKHPEKWNNAATIALAFAGLVGELEVDTKSAFLKQLEEGLILAVTTEVNKNPITP